MADGPFAHEALLYRDPAEFIAGTMPFVEGGLAVGEPVMVAAPRRSTDLLRAALGRAAERVSFLDMTQAGRNPGRIIPWVLHAFIDRHHDLHARIIGEPIWPGRSPEEYPACMQHEALVNTVFLGRSATILCPYDAAMLDAAVLADAERTHPIVVDGAGRRPSVGYTEPATVVEAFNRPLPEPPDPAAGTAFDMAGLPEVRRLALEHALSAGLDPSRAQDFQVAVNEIASNTITHANGRGRLRIWTEPGTVVCDIRDGGRLADLLAGRLPAPPDSDRGRGLLLVNHLCDLVRIHTSPEYTAVRLYMHA